MAQIADNEEIHKINMQLSSRIQNIYLVGSKSVQKALSEFLLVFKQETNKEKQDKLYAELILQMKLDLYRRKAIKEYFTRKADISLDKIEFTVFSGEKGK